MLEYTRKVANPPGLLGHARYPIGIHIVLFAFCYFVPFFFPCVFMIHDWKGQHMGSGISVLIPYSSTRSAKKSLSALGSSPTFLTSSGFRILSSVDATSKRVWNRELFNLTKNLQSKKKDRYTISKRQTATVQTNSPFPSTFRLCRVQSTKISFIHMQILGHLHNTNFHVVESFARSLVLKQRRKATQKWPIDFLRLAVVEFMKLDKIRVSLIFLKTEHKYTKW